MKPGLAFVLFLWQGGCDCGGPGPQPTDARAEDAPPIDAGPSECPPLPRFEMGDPNGAPNPLDVPAGEARAGRLSQDMLPEDPFGLAVWKPGDFVLASGAGYALLIESARVSDLYDRFGGKPVGIARIEGGRLVDPGEFNELIFGVSTFLLETQSVSVTNDGRNGQAAVIRAIGRMKAIDFLGSVPEAFRGGAQLEGFPAMVEYRMAPGASHVDFEITVGNPNP
ncbi:MAG: hypothetical protein N2515_10445, partial [Deltaproteobacteria bacterium]|nr:hypothetical protein [Deltaproteobacteria bacterium]